MKYLITTMFFIFITCGNNNISEEKNILEMYSQLAVEFHKGNFRGIMKPYSKDFTSDENDLKNYNDVMKYNASLLRTNSSIFINFYDFNFEINENSAQVEYTLHFKSRQREFKIKRRDHLKKEWWQWKVISTEYLD